MTCPECTAAKTNPLHGVYQHTCVDCCARHVLAGRPLRKQQEQVLAVIAMNRNAPSRDRILQRVKEMRSE